MTRRTTPRPLVRRLRSAAKRALSGAAALSGLYRLAGTAYGGLGVVFTLHRVVEPGRPVLWPGYEIHADVLDEMLTRVRRSGWQAVSMDEVHRRLSGGEKGGRFVSFTLDDGYADALRLALPVFRRHGTPFCVYVSTGLVERSVFYWWGGLADLVAANDRIEWKGAGGEAPRVLAAGSWEEKQRAYAALNDLCDRAGPEATRELLGAYRVDWRAAMDRNALTVAQTRQLAADPLATIGAHGLAHERLARMSDAEAWRELAEGRRILEGWIGREVRHVAYPFGGRDACGPREFELAKSAGYATGVTTRRGNLFPAHRDHLTCLPRREVPIDAVRLRNALSGVESVFRGRPRFQAV